MTEESLLRIPSNGTDSNSGNVEKTISEEEAAYVELCMIFAPSDIVKLKRYQRHQLISLWMNTGNIEACQTYLDKCLHEKEGK